MLRMIVAICGGVIALRVTGSLNWLFAALALGLLGYATTIVAAIAGGAWFPRPTSRTPLALPRAAA